MKSLFAQLEKTEQCRFQVLKIKAKPSHGFEHYQTYTYKALCRHTHTHTHTRIHYQISTHTYIHTQQTHTTNTHAHKETHKHTRAHAHAHARAHTNTQTRTHATNIRTHAFRHQAHLSPPPPNTHTHTCTHMHTQALMDAGLVSTLCRLLSCSTTESTQKLQCLHMLRVLVHDPSTHAAMVEAKAVHTIVQQVYTCVCMHVRCVCLHARGGQGCAYHCAAGVYVCLHARVCLHAFFFLRVCLKWDGGRDSGRKLAPVCEFEYIDLVVQMRVASVECVLAFLAAGLVGTVAL